MKRALLLTLIISLGLGLVFAQAADKDTKTKIILLIAEQNIEGPQHAWWASEIDLSTTESALANKLIESGYEVLEPSAMNKIIKKDRAFRVLGLSDATSVKIGNLSRAKYVVVGKAIASAGANVPQSSMRSCFANVTAKLIRVKDGSVLAYLDASGTSAHMDVVTGGKEALSKAGNNLAQKLVDLLNKQGGI